MNIDTVNKAINELEVQWLKDFGDICGMFRLNSNFDLYYTNGSIFRRQHFDTDDEYSSDISIKDLNDKDLSECIDALPFLKEKSSK